LNLLLNPHGHELGQEQPGMPKGTDEQSILTSLNRGDAISAERKAKEADLPPDAWGRIENAADDKINKLNPHGTTERPLQPAQAEKVVTLAGDQAILNYGKEQVPFMNTVSESQKALEKNGNTIQEILQAIQQAKKHARRVRIPIPIYGLFQTKKLKDDLTKLEGLNAQLKNPADISYKLQADKISPDSSDKTFIKSLAVSGAGYGVLAGTAYATNFFPAATATTGQAIAVFGGFTAGTVLYLSGFIGLAIGGIKKLMNIRSANKTIDELENLETEMLELKTKNAEALGQVKGINTAYVQGARANLGSMIR